LRTHRRLPMLLSALLALAAAASPVLADRGGGDVRQYSSKYYDVYTNLPRETAAAYARHMDLTAAHYAKRFAGLRAKDRSRMAVYLFDLESDYHAHMASIGVDSRNSGGMFAVQPRNDVKGLFTWVSGRSKRDVLSVLQHEGFHQFAYAFIGGDLPPWANEGMAQYFEDGIIIGRDMHLGLVNPHRLRQVQEALANKSNLMSFRELMTMDGQQWSANLRADARRGGLQYAYAWSVVHFLVHADNGRYQRAFLGYLDLIASGRTSEQAFQRAFGTADLEAMRKRWSQYVMLLDPDPLAEATLRMEFLGRALSALHEKGHPAPESIEAVRKTLTAAGYKSWLSTHGLRYEFDASDEALYGYTPTPRTLPGRRARDGGDAEEPEPVPFELVPPKNPDFPPGVTAPQLRPAPTLTWEKDEHGELVAEVTYK